MAIDLTKLEKKFIDLFANVTQEEFEQWLLTKNKPMAQETAVDWFAKQVEENLGWHPVEIIEQAKQMEKEQIIKSHCDGFYKSAEGWNGEYGLNDIFNIAKEIDAEQYYNETYKNNI